MAVLLPLVRIAAHTASPVPDAELLDRFAAEHVSVQVREIASVPAKLINAGAVFVGPYSPVATASTPVSVSSAPTGQWSSLMSWPLVAIHMTLVPTGDVLMWDRQALGGAVAQLWTPATGMFTAVPNVTTDIFCASHSALADGRIFVAGGDNASAGLRDANIFDPSTGRWALAASMAYSEASVEPTKTRLFKVRGEDSTAPPVLQAQSFWPVFRSRA